MTLTNAIQAIKDFVAASKAHNKELIELLKEEKFKFNDDNYIAMREMLYNKYPSAWYTTDAKKLKNLRIHVSKCDYGKRYPDLGEHTQYTFNLASVDKNNKIDMPYRDFEYSILVKHQFLKHTVIDNRDTEKYLVFDSAFTKEGAEKKAEKRAKDALELICNELGAKQHENCPNRTAIYL
ncbi:MAG: hypothetical protein WC916_02680 [Candidatus Woesearchaeota archaeon]